jgi:hypothetical protein
MATNAELIESLRALAEYVSGLDDGSGDAKLYRAAADALADAEKRAETAEAKLNEPIDFGALPARCPKKAPKVHHRCERIAGHDDACFYTAHRFFDAEGETGEECGAVRRAEVAEKRIAAVDDERRVWSGRPGHSNGPRFYHAIASTFSAGDSIRAVADWYGIPEADVVLAARQQIRDLAKFAKRVARAIDAFDAPRALCAPEDTAPAEGLSAAPPAQEVE